MLAFLADARRRTGSSWRRARSSASTPMRRPSFSPAARAYKVKRAVRFPFLDYSTLEKRKAACEAELAVNRAVRARSSIAASCRSRASRTAGSRSTARATPVEWAVEMARFDETATLDQPGGTRRARSRARRRARSRRRRASTPRRRSPTREPWIDALADYIEQNRGELSAIIPSCSSRAEVEALSQASRAALRRTRSPAARARPGRPGPARPWRPPSRQYRADRRQAGAVRRHRVRSADRHRRRALRPRVPADGSDRARTRRRRQRRAQPLSGRDPPRSRISTGSRRCRCSCRCAPRSAPR